MRNGKSSKSHVAHDEEDVSHNDNEDAGNNDDEDVGHNDDEDAGHNDDEDVGDDDTPEPEMPIKQSNSSRGKGKSMGSKDVNAQLQIGKIRHLKKEDGEPLWRKDIQYDFLRAVFDNDLRVFTNSWEPERPKQCFADLYIDTMARSSKTSKVLRDKLLSDRDAAKGMAMVCLLVNIGRMNTTLNCTRPLLASSRRKVHSHSDPLHSLPRDASSVTNVPCDPIPSSPTGSTRLQTVAGCAETEIDFEGRHGGSHRTQRTH
jgi:hypothetical protein